METSSMMAGERLAATHPATPSLRWKRARRWPLGGACTETMVTRVLLVGSIIASEQFRTLSSSAALATTRLRASARSSAILGPLLVWIGWERSEEHTSELQ